MLTSDQYQVRVIRAFPPYSNGKTLIVGKDISSDRADYLQNQNFIERVQHNDAPTVAVRKKRRAR